MAENALDVVREALAVAWPEGDHAEPNVFTEALAVLSVFEAQAEEERVQLGAHKLMLKDERRWRVEAEAERDRLAARVAELEAALREIADFGAPGRKFRSPLASVIRLQGIARAALARPREQQEGA